MSPTAASVDLVRGNTATAATDAGADDLVANFRAMAADVRVRVLRPTSAAPSALARAEEVFRRVEAACTRFDPTSPLMIANETPRRWHRVPTELYRAIEAAQAAYHETGGLFDPRILTVLRGLGYDTSLSFRDGSAGSSPDATPTPRTTRLVGLRRLLPRRPDATAAPGARPWRPRLDAHRGAVRLGPAPIDLGGIGKGLAVRWAADEIRSTGTAALVEAGGDLQAIGSGPEGTGWRVAVEDPRGGIDPVAVLSLTDAACATSSVRVRRWRANGAQVHHLIDPRTGTSGGRGLLAVTVVDDDPAHAEVWSKALFLSGRTNVRGLADERGIAALLVDTDGAIGMSRAMRSHLLWQAPRGW